MELKDLKVSQLTTACGAITGKPVTATSFNYKAKAIERVEALMREHDLTMTDVLKSAGITMIDARRPPMKPAAALSGSAKTLRYGLLLRRTMSP